MNELASIAPQTTPLGSTGMNISRVGFGSWAAGGDDWGGGWGPQDDQDSIAAIRFAVENGVNWIDTAAIYGLGHAEEVIAEALRPFPMNMRPYVFTKCGIVGDPAHRWDRPQHIGANASIRRELEQSLRRLAVERIDLYQMHWPARDGTSIEEYWQTFLDLKREGKVRAVGLSNHDTTLLRRAERVGHVDTLQPPFSAIKRDSAASEIPWCLANGTGVIIYSPMQAGLLTGAFTEERAASLLPNDWRSRNEEFTGEKLKRNLALVEAIRPIAERHNVSLASFAVAWAIAWPGATAAIVGARKPSQVNDWLGAATVRLAESDLKEVRLAIERTGAGSGPSDAAASAR